MLIVVLLVLPLLGAAVAAVVRPYRAWVAVTTVVLSGAEFAVGVLLASRCLAGLGDAFGPGDFLRVDGLTAVIVLVVTGVAWISSWFGTGYMHRSRDHKHIDTLLLRRYYILNNLFVFTMLLAVTANNVGLMWVAVEATTITTAFLIGLQPSKASLEASWKYILIGSVGIALAFLGTVLGYFNFVQRVGQTEFALHWTVLSQVAGRLNGDVLRLAFVFLVLGYGTKAGLAPMHTWLPDAHSEAPAPISAMMSGSLLVVALYAIMRWKKVVDVCVGPVFSNRILVIIGLLSLCLAAVMLLRQSSYKRMLAYSSVEHMGLMCLGLGLGPLGTTAALLHAMGHGAGKSLMFLLSGRILQGYQTTRIAAVHGLMRSMPWTGGLFCLGAVALLGLPPFGLFLSKFLLLRASFEAGFWWVGGLALLFTTMVFVAFLGSLNRMLYGTVPEGLTPLPPDFHGLAPLGLNVAALLVLGLAVPEPLLRLIAQAVEVICR